MFTEPMYRAIEADELVQKDYDSYVQIWNDRASWVRRGVEEGVDLVSKFDKRGPAYEFKKFRYAWRVASYGWGAISMHTMVAHFPRGVEGRDDEAKWSEADRNHPRWRYRPLVEPWSGLEPNARISLANWVIAMFDGGPDLAGPPPTGNICGTEEDLLFGVVAACVPESSRVGGLLEALAARLAALSGRGGWNAPSLS
jgi:hypothetical protein